MTALDAFTRNATDEELSALVGKLAARWAGAPSGPGRVWCFMEGATRSGFLEPMALNADLLAKVWLVRLFGAAGELAARRTGFDAERPWLLRVIATQVEGEGWAKHELEARAEISLALYGDGHADGTFREGMRFPDPFVYPSLDGSSSGGVSLVIEEYRLGDGTSIARWVRLEGNQPRNPKQGKRV